MFVPYKVQNRHSVEISTAKNLVYGYLQTKGLALHAKLISSSPTSQSRPTHGSQLLLTEQQMSSASIFALGNEPLWGNDTPRLYPVLAPSCSVRKGNMHSYLSHVTAMLCLQK